MDRIEKFKSLSVAKADAKADIGLINQFSVKKLTPEEVFCFSVVLCDNDIDRDCERFTDGTLETLAEMFVGKTGISDHYWSAERQIARLYRCQVETTAEKNALGQTLKRLRGSAYMVRSDATQPVIDAIEAGIMKEVSIACAISKCLCSICHEPIQLDWNTYTYRCKNDHVKGETYPEGLCVGELTEPTDAYEFSFVAVPAQRGAGVTKSAQDAAGAFETLMTADLTSFKAQIEKLLPRLGMALEDVKAREKRAEILRENEKFLKG